MAFTVADRQSQFLGLQTEAIDLKKEKNFFETRVTEYQAGSSLKW